MAEEQFAAPLFETGGPNQFKEALSGVAKAVGDIGSQFDALATRAQKALSTISTQLDAINAKAAQVAKAVQGAGVQGTAATGGRGNPANSVLASSGVGGNPGNVMGVGGALGTYFGMGAWGIGQGEMPGYQTFGRMGEGAYGIPSPMGGAPGSTFGGPNGGGAYGGGGGFSYGRLAGGAALVGLGAASRYTQNATPTGTTWRQLMFNVSSFSNMNQDQSRRYAQQFTGWGGDVGNLMQGIQTLNGVPGVGTVGSQGFTRAANQAGALAMISQASGGNMTFSDAANAQSYLSSAAGRASLGRMGFSNLAPNSTNMFSVAELVSQRLGNGRMLTGNQIGSMARPGGALYNTLSQMGFDQGTVQAQVSYLERQQKAGGFNAKTTLGSANLSTAQESQVMKQLGYSQTDINRQLATQEQQARNKAPTQIGAADTGTAMNQAVTNFKAGVDNFVDASGKLRELLGGGAGGIGSSIGGLGGVGGSILGHVGGSLIAQLLLRRMGGLGGIFGKLPGAGGGAAGGGADLAGAGEAVGGAAAGGGLLSKVPGLGGLAGEGGAASFGRLLGPVGAAGSLAVGPLWQAIHGQWGNVGSDVGGDVKKATGGQVGLGGGLSIGASLLERAPVIGGPAKHMMKWLGFGANGTSTAGNSGGKTTPTATPALPSGSRVVTDAQKYLGIPYKWGGTNPKTGLDCSGLVQLVYKDVGVSLPRTSQEQAKVGQAVGNLKAAQPGDLLFYAGSDGTPSAPGHVGIYVGSNKMIDAPHTGAPVRYDSAGSPVAIRRVLGGNGAAATSNTNGGLTAAASAAAAAPAGNTPAAVGGTGLLGEGNASTEGSVLSAAMMPTFTLAPASTALGGGVVGGSPGNTMQVGGAAPTAKPGGPIPTGQHLALIKQSFGIAHIADTGANEAAVNTIVTHESSWNASAVNRTDSNAAAGHPSQGLMQTIPSTFAAYALPPYNKNILDPLSNLIAGERYAISRYGALTNVPGVKGVASGKGYVGYEVGSQYIDRDQVAMLHRGEMVVRSGAAAAMRMNQMSAGPEATITISFEKGSVVYSPGAGGSATPSSSVQQDMDDLAERLTVALERKKSRLEVALS